MNIEEKLMPLLNVLNKSHPTNTKEDCMEYICHIHDAIKQIKELKESFKVSCSYCTHYLICKVVERVENLRQIDDNKIAWLCKKFKRYDME